VQRSLWWCRSCVGVLLCCLWLMACRHRMVISGDDAGPSELLDGQTFIPLPDGYSPQVCMKEEISVAVWNDPRANFSLAVPLDAQVLPLTITGAVPGESAAAVSYRNVAGLAATRAGSKDPATELAALQQRFAQDLFQAGLGHVTVRGSGTVGTSHDGFPDAKEAAWDVETLTSIEPGELLHVLLGSALLKPQTAISGLPGPVADPATQFVVKLTLVQRGGQVALSAAVATRAAEENVERDTSFIVEDLGNGTALAKAAATTLLECDKGVMSATPTADILWVIDESGSMSDNRQDVANNANAFFDLATASGLDFRMGVTGVRKPEAGIEVGKLCSRASSNTSDDGGEDRFLLPSERATFSACVWNPPYYEPHLEYGLSAAYWAVKRHLPRAVGSPSKIRDGAKLAIIFITDEAPQELKTDGSFNGKSGFLSEADVKSSVCTLSPADQSSLTGFIAPIRDLLSGVAEPGGQAQVHVIGGLCNNSCNAELAHGYKDLAAARGGQVGDVCQKDLSATLKVILKSIASAASPRALHHSPISSSLVVEVNGQHVPRSSVKGFVYSAAANALTFVNVPIAKGMLVAASYRRFTGSK
jgi:hypothetical protein